MKGLTVIFTCLLFFSFAAQSQSSGANNWLSFIIQAEGRPGGNTNWEMGQRLEINKRAGVALSRESTAGLIRFDPQDKEVRFTFSNFTLDGAWFTPSEVAVVYQEGEREIGPIKALPGSGRNDFFQMTLRFREVTKQSTLSVRLIGRTSGKYLKDTVNTLLVWGSGGAESSDVQFSYLDNNPNFTPKSAYGNNPSSYGAYQGRLGQPAGGSYTIQLGAYSVLPDARQFSGLASYGQPYSRRIGSLHYVRIGAYNDVNQAQQNLQRIRAYYPEAYVVMEDSNPQQAAPAYGNINYNTSPYGQQPSLYGNINSPRLPSGDMALKGTTPSTSYDLPSTITGYAIQLASYRTEEKAIEALLQLRQRGIAGLYVWKKDGNNRLVVAPFPSKLAAGNYLESLKRQYQQDGILVYLGN